MRRFLLSSTFLLLVGGLLLLQSHRFERVVNSPALGLADFKNAMPDLPEGAEWQGDSDRPSLRLTAGAGHRQVAMQIALPGRMLVEALHVQFEMSAHHLSRGRNPWDDGRVLIQWRSPDGNTEQEVDPIGSLHDNQASGDVSVVARPLSGSAIPVLRLENLGQGGELRISKLEMSPVKQRPIWEWGGWLLLISWFAWIFAFISGGTKALIWRRFLAAAIWIAMGVTLAFPGPWKTLHPFLISFDLGPSAGMHANVEENTSRGGIAAIPASFDFLPSANHGELGRIPLQGSWIIRAKHHLAKLRPLLHILLLLLPTLGFRWLVGRKRAVDLAVALALSIEGAQTAFGYGFDYLDVFDLACDAVGIVLALWVYDRISKRLKGKWCALDERAAAGA